MDHKRVIHELTQGKEFANQLKIHLDNPSSSSNEIQEILIHNILNSYDTSLSLLTARGLNPNGWSNNNDSAPSHEGMEIIAPFEPQVSLSDQSPCSEDADDEYKDPDRKDLNTKRKSNMQKWKNQVKVRGDMGFEEALDDGYSWRKYGQKDILGAKHPRGYYRCTYRQTQGCPATKQVQQTDKHTSMFDITYHGSHTCNPKSHTASTLSPPQNERHQAISLFHFPSTSKNIINLPILDTTSSMAQPRVDFVEKNPMETIFESELNDIVLAATSTTSSHNVDVGYSFGEMEFGNIFSFDDSMFYDLF